MPMNLQMIWSAIWPTNQFARARARAPYVLQRFVRRNWRPLTAAAAVFVILLAGIGAVAWQARIARIEAHKTLAVKNFLLDIVRQNSTDNPDGETARHTTAEQLLDISGKKIVSGLRDQPEVRGEMLMTLGDLYDQLELFDKAEILARERLADLRGRGAGPSAQMAEAEVALGRNLAMEGHYPEASAELGKALSSLNQIQDFHSATRAHALLELGRIGYHTKAVDDAETLQQLQQATELYRQCCADSPEQLATMQMLARLAENRHDIVEAERRYRQFLALAKSPAFAAQAPIESGHAYEDLGSFLLVRRRYEEAQVNLRQAVDIYGKFGLADVLIAANKLTEARSLLSQASDAQSKQPALGEQYRQPLRLARARLARAQP
jgi:eukaryotic-like serine/threonine-protein kinase